MRPIVVAIHGASMIVDQANVLHREDDLSAFLLHDNLRSYLHYESLMQHWINIFPNQILNVSYEKLTSDPKNEIKKVFNFCNIEWEDSCLEFYKNKNKVETESFFQVRKKIYTSSINKYDPYIDYFKDFFSKLNFKSIF